jgi:hypothetical protein
MRPIQELILEALVTTEFDVIVSARQPRQNLAAAVWLRTFKIVRDLGLDRRTVLKWILKQ